LLGLIGLGAWWALSSKEEGKAQVQVRNAPPNNPPDQGAMKKTEPAKAESRKKEPPRAEQPPAEPPKANAPPAEPPKKEPPRAEPPAVWAVKADPPAAPVKLPADFKKEVAAPGALAQLRFPAGLSPFVLIGTNLRAEDERQVWNLQTGQMTGKVVGKIDSSRPPILSPDGAHVAFHDRPGTVDVWAPGPGKKVTIDVGAGLLTDYTDFAGGKLLTARKVGTALQFQLWDVATGQSVLTFVPPGTQTGISRDGFAVSPGGAYLALASRESLLIFDLKAGTLVGQRAMPKWEPGRIVSCHGLSFSPDGSELAGLFYGTVSPMHLVCWDVAKGEVVSENSVPLDRPQAGTLAVYRGHVLDWVGDRRGWLLYGYTMVERGKDGSATFLPQPPQTGSPIPRHLVGPGHVATLAAAAKPGEFVLTVRPFDADKPN
jgi:hypothetical protein